MKIFKLPMRDRLIEVILKANSALTGYFTSDSEISFIITENNHDEITVKLACSNADTKLQGEQSVVLTKLPLNDVLNAIGVKNDYDNVEDFKTDFDRLTVQCPTSLTFSNVDNTPTITFLGKDDINVTLPKEETDAENFFHFIKGGSFIVNIKVNIPPDASLDFVLRNAETKPIKSLEEASSANRLSQIELTPEGHVKSKVRAKADHIEDRFHLPPNVVKLSFTMPRDGIWLTLNGVEDNSMILRIGGNAGSINRCTNNRSRWLLKSVGNLTSNKTAFKWDKQPRVGYDVELYTGKENGKDVLYGMQRKPGTDEWINFMKAFPEDFNDFYNPDYNLSPNGIVVGVTGNENIGTPASEQVFVIKNVEYAVFGKPESKPPHPSDPPSEGSSDNQNEDPVNNKYLIVLTGGQSNMVGYDESVVDISDYPENPRLLQMGVYGNARNTIIPLGVHAHGYQDMRPFSNVNNPSPNLGTKGMHYPLAKAIMEAVDEKGLNLNDYKILVINGSYGSTTFGGNDGDAGLTEDGLLPKTLSSGARWGVNTSYYRSLRNRLNKILTENPDSKFVGFFWMQGEHGGSSNLEGMKAMRDDFLTYARASIPVEKRLTPRVEINDLFYFIEANAYWKRNSSYRQYLDSVKAIEGMKYVAVPDDAPTNSVNGTGRTSSVRDAHFGNNAYRTHVVPAIMSVVNDVLSK